MMLVEENERGSFVLVFKVETFQQFEEHKFFLLKKKTHVTAPFSVLSYKK